MRIYNGKSASIEVPLYGDKVRVVAPGFGLSQDFMPNDNFLQLIAQAYEEDQIALIVSGPFEINMLAKFPTLAPMTVQSLDEAISRFVSEDEVVEAKEEDKCCCCEEKEEKCNCEECNCEQPKEEEVCEVVEEEVEKPVLRTRKRK